MTKKQTKISADEEQRQSRKQVLVARKEREQKRVIYTGIAIVGGILAVVFIFGIVYELFITPNRAVAEVSGTQISLSDWQDRVRFERAQRIVLLENQLESFNDVGLIQQFYGQAINELMQPDVLGQTVLNTMAEDVVVLQEAETRGITVTDAEIDEAIGESFSFFNGQSPTPLPEPTQTIMPTPSLTPIPTAVITELLPTNTPFPTPTLGPTNTPLPTPTPKSEEAFQQEWSDFLADYEALGISEAQYRAYVRLQLFREKLAEALAEERELPTEAEHTSFFFMAFPDEAGANEALAMVEQDGYVPVWNELRSLPADPEAEAAPIISEVLWRTQSDVASSFGEEIASSAFTLPLDQPSEILVYEAEDGTSLYLIIMPTGREMRELSESAIQQAKSQELVNFLDTLLTGNLTFTEFDQGRVPDTPRLDTKFLATPTPTPGAALPLGTAVPGAVPTEVPGN